MNEWTFKPLIELKSHLANESVQAFPNAYTLQSGCLSIKIKIILLKLFHVLIGIEQFSNENLLCSSDQIQTNVLYSMMVKIELY